MEHTTTAIDSIAAILMAVTTFIGAAVAFWQHVKARNYRAAADDGHTTLVAVIAGLEAASQLRPSDALTTAKTHIQGLADALGVEGPILADKVQDLEAVVRRVIEAAARENRPVTPAELASALQNHIALGGGPRS